MKLELRRVTLATPSARNAIQSWPTRERLLLRVSDSDGWGLGEAAPLPGYSRESLDDVERALRLLEASDVRRQASAREWSEGSKGLPAAAQFGLETALLDYGARREGISAPTLLGAQVGASVSLSCLLGTASDVDLVEQARRALEAGYRCLKVKLGAPSRQRAELDGVARLRAAVGDDVKVRLDANGAWTASEVTQAWPILSHLDIDFFEEPGDVPEALRGVLPLALDESLQGVAPDALDALVARTGATAVVLKPTALGGIAHCLSLAERARSLGCLVTVSHCFEGPIGFRAAAALALALPAAVAHGLAPYPGAAFDARDGVLESWSEPGLNAPERFE
jgi:o-succinylbenzoate synthase